MKTVILYQAATYREYCSGVSSDNSSEAWDGFGCGPLYGGERSSFSDDGGDPAPSLVPDPDIET